MDTPLKTIAVLATFVIGLAPLPGQSQQAGQFELVPKIVFSHRNPSCPQDFYKAFELFLVDPDGSNGVQWTDTDGCTHSDYFASLSPDGKKIVLDSTRNGASTVPGSLFVMASDGTQPLFLTRGSSSTWSSDSRHVAFHASSGFDPVQIRNQPGAPTKDSDIFVANVGDVIAGTALPTNITNSPETIDEDADWSPDGTKIVFTSDPAWDWQGVPFPMNPNNYPTKEIFMVNPDGTELTQVTFNTYEERAPAWSPDGSRIGFIGRVGARGGNTFEICVMNADGSNQVQLTDNDAFEGTMTWSPDGRKIIFQRPAGANPTLLYAVDADTTCNTNKPVKNSCHCSAGVGDACVTQLTTEGVSLFPHLGQLRVHVSK